ncbi:MAG: site-specific integrase [Deltaproteobacteria bacterium]|nr:site-specific integrase [Deltaproteobacteria bacterium]
MADLRPRHIREFVEKLKVTKKKRQVRRDGSLTGEEGETIAPRTVLHIYGTLRSMLNDAVADEVIPSSPCILKDKLPEKKDKDRTWRRTAVFTRDEVQTIISADPQHIPEDRRVMYAIMFLGAMRFGEAAAVTWRDYDAAATPLGKLVVEKSYSSKLKKVKTTKTDNPREMPVHPTLAKILAAWKLEGFERFMGRPPKPEDLIVPSRQKRPRNANHMLRRFHEDLERVGLRARRQHDARRTFISIARADGARPDILRWATHGPTGDIVDDYTTLPWPTLCEEVAKVRVSVLEGKVIELPLAATGRDASAAHAIEPAAPIALRSVPAIEVIDMIDAETTKGPAAESPVTAKPVDPQEGRYTTRYRSVSTGNEQSKWRSGRDSNPRPPA